MSKGPKPRPPIERLLERVVVQPNGCWLWTGRPDTKGYSMIWVGSKTDGSRRLVRGHILSYQHFVGEIPKGFDLDHRCHNVDTSCPGGEKCLHRVCVNPFHLEPSTRRENILRGKTIAAEHAKKTRCPLGHLYAGDNLRVSKRGERVCVACRRKQDKERYWADPEKFRARARKAV